jgi:glycosyltransferase involved in cell wall biosynthesis
MAAWLTDLLTDGLVVNSAAVARQIQGKNRLLRRRVFAVPNAVEPIVGEQTEVRHRAAGRWKIPTSRLWLGSIGRFETSKRFDLLLELTAWLVSRGGDPQLVLIGYGPGMDDLKRMATVLGIEGRVTFTGADAEARFWARAFDVFCCTSLEEGLPNVVMEAAAAGVPVLGWRTDFMLELLTDGESAVLVEPGNVEGLREGLRRLVENSEYRLSLGERAQKEVLGKFGVPTFVGKLSAVYEELLATKSDKST